MRRRTDKEFVNEAARRRGKPSINNLQIRLTKRRTKIQVREYISKRRRWEVHLRSCCWHQQSMWIILGYGIFFTCYFSMRLKQIGSVKCSSTIFVPKNAEKSCDKANNNLSRRTLVAPVLTGKVLSFINVFFHVFCITMDNPYRLWTIDFFFFAKAKAKLLLTKNSRNSMGHCPK